MLLVVIPVRGLQAEVVAMYDGKHMKWRLHTEQMKQILLKKANRSNILKILLELFISGLI